MAMALLGCTSFKDVFGGCEKVESGKIANHINYANVGIAITSADTGGFMFHRAKVSIAKARP